MRHSTLFVVPAQAGTHRWLLFAVISPPQSPGSEGFCGKGLSLAVFLGIYQRDQRSVQTAWEQEMPESMTQTILDAVVGLVEAFVVRLHGVKHARSVDDI